MADQITPAMVRSLSKLRDLCGSLPKTRAVEYGGRTQYRYTTLDDVLELMRPVLREAGLIVRQEILQRPDRGVGVGTEIICEADCSTIRQEVFEPEAEAAGAQKNPLQAMGSSITYLRRYALTTALGLASDDDDDGTGAAERWQGRREQQATAAEDGTPERPRTFRDRKQRAERERRLCSLLMGGDEEQQAAAPMVPSLTDEELVALWDHVKAHRPGLPSTAPAEEVEA